jgi:hypothetical protein
VGLCDFESIDCFKPSRTVFVEPENIKLDHLVVIRRFRPGYSAAYIRSELTNLQKLLVPCPICALFADESFSNSLVSAGVRPFGARVSGNLQPHPLHSYPLRATDAATRGLFISTVSSANTFVGTSYAFNIMASVSLAVE